MSEIILRIKNSRFHNSVFELLICPYCNIKIKTDRNSYKSTRLNSENYGSHTITWYVLYFVVEEILQSCNIDTAEEQCSLRRTSIYNRAHPLTPKVSIFDESQYNHTMSGSCWGVLGEGVLLLVLPAFLVSLALGSSLSSPTWSKYERITDKKCKLITVALLLRK